MPALERREPNREETMSQTIRPKVGLLALTLELYETAAADLRGSRKAGCGAR